MDFTYQGIPIEELEYEDFCRYLFSVGSQEKAEFEKRIVNTKYPVFGLYSTQKDALFSYLKKRDHTKILSYPNKDFETLCLQGRLIANAIIPFLEKKEKLLGWLSCVDSWALTDCVLKGVRIKESERPLWISFSQDLVSRKEEFFIRFGVIILLSFFLTDDAIGNVFDTLKKANTGDYYVDMAIAWLCATALIKYKKEALSFLKNAENVNVFILKKSFQKARESFRISDIDKQEYAGFLRSVSQNGTF